jgi:hypothetical protein
MPVYLTEATSGSNWTLISANRHHHRRSRATKVVVALAAAAIAVSALTAQPADARAKKKSQHRTDTAPYRADTAPSLPSLDGRTTGRPRTCGYQTFQYDGFGVPYGPYCH